MTIGSHRQGSLSRSFQADHAQSFDPCIPVPWQPGEFTQGILSCYLLSSENTLLAAKQKISSAIRLITFGRLEIRTIAAITAACSCLDKPGQRRWT
jgi:hypothetical protein